MAPAVSRPRSGSSEKESGSGSGQRCWEWFDQVLGAGPGEDGVPPQAAMLLDVGFAARRSPGLAAALGRGWRA